MDNLKTGKYDVRSENNIDKLKVTPTKDKMDEIHLK